MNTNDLYYLNKDNHKKSIGGTGVKIITEGQTPSGVTGITSGTYYAIHFITTCTPTTFTATNSEIPTGIAYDSGTIIYCDVTGIVCGTGESYILYKC